MAAPQGQGPSPHGLGFPQGIEPIYPRPAKRSALVRAPSGLKAPGRRLWTAVSKDFEMAEHEAAQLAEACFVRDRIEQLRRQVDADGLMIGSSQGVRLHPGVAEIRAQQLTMARILATLGVPSLEDDALPPARGVRGTYTMRGRS